VFDGATSLGVTSPPGTGSCGDNPSTCFADPNASHGVFNLPAGTHSITIKPTVSPFAGGAAYFRVDPPDPATPSGCATMDIVPNGQVVGVGEDFFLTVQVHAGLLPIDGAAFYLNFDPTKLRVIDQFGNPINQVVPGGLLPDVFTNMVDNTTGQINFAAGKLTGPLPSGDFPVAYIGFRPIATGSNVPLVFQHAGARQTDITSGGASVFANSVDGFVTIVPSGGVHGHVFFQGRGPQGDDRWDDQELDVTLFEVGTGRPLRHYHAFTDEGGAFMIVGIPTASYDIVVKHRQTVSRIARVSITTGNVDRVFGELPAGDVQGFGDDQINVRDFSALRAAFGTTPMSPNWNPNADLAVDLKVDILDFSLLRRNFGTSGPLPAP
jgi:hypothetical protein